MRHCPQNSTAELLGKKAGSNNVCSANFAAGEVNVIGRGRFRQRAPRVGLLGGRQKRHSTIDRFWARVQKNPDGCWVFAGAPSNNCGHIHISREDGSRVYAHRFSYELHRGPIPAGKKVCHACDVAACVNPDHLFVGSQKDNVHDAIAKGRFAPWLHPNTVAARHARTVAAARAARPLKVVGGIR